MRMGYVTFSVPQSCTGYVQHAGSSIVTSQIWVGNPIVAPLSVKSVELLSPIGVHRSSPKSRGRTQDVMPVPGTPAIVIGFAAMSLAAAGSARDPEHHPGARGDPAVLPHHSVSLRSRRRRRRLDSSGAGGFYNMPVGVALVKSYRQAGDVYIGESSFQVSNDTISYVLVSPTPRTDVAALRAWPPVKKIDDTTRVGLPLWRSVEVRHEALTIRSFSSPAPWSVLSVGDGPGAGCRSLFAGLSGTRGATPTRPAPGEPATAPRATTAPGRPATASKAPTSARTIAGSDAGPCGPRWAAASATPVGADVGAGAGPGSTDVGAGAAAPRAACRTGWRVRRRRGIVAGDRDGQGGGRKRSRNYGTPRPGCPTGNRSQRRSSGGSPLRTASARAGQNHAKGHTINAFRAWV